MTRSNGESNIGSGDRPAVLHLDERKTVDRCEDPQIAALLPEVDPICRPPLQHAYGRLEMERRPGAQRRVTMSAA
ncbi:hypothetical protein D3C83_97130 [compost metagenome]